MGVFLVIQTNIAVFTAISSLKNEMQNSGLPRNDFYFSDFTSAYLLVLYGIPTLVTAGIKNFKPMLVGGIVCWVCAVLVVYTPREADMLLMALSAISAWLIPGLILRRYCATKQQMPDV